MWKRKVCVETGLEGVEKLVMAVVEPLKVWEREVRGVGYWKGLKKRFCGERGIGTGRGA